MPFLMGRSRVRTVLMSGLSSGLSCQHSLRQSRTKSKLFSNSSNGGLKQFPWGLIRWYQVLFLGNTLVSYVSSSGNLADPSLFRSLRPHRILTEVKQSMLSSSWAIYSCGPLVNLIQTYPVYGAESLACAGPEDQAVEFCLAKTHLPPGQTYL